MSRPSVTLKLATTLDGRIATHEGQSRWITGEEARRVVHELRAGHDAVLVGIGTVLRDDPELTVRHVTGRSPTRVVLDSHLHLPLSSRLAHIPPATWVLTTEDAPVDREERLRERGAVVIRIPESGGRVDLIRTAGVLAERGVTRLLVEGGPQIHGAFLDAGLADRIIVFVAPKVLGGDGAPSAVAGLGAETPDGAPLFTVHRVETLGGDVMLEARPGMEAT